ncbi:MAG: hypothetical protein MUC57_15440 [Desulfobacterales bacterium]|nr:hypothetical protein [Desulfobacterales bacterium]
MTGPFGVGKEKMFSIPPEGRQPVPAQRVSGNLNRIKLDHQVLRFRIRVNLPEGFDGEAGEVDTYTGRRIEKILRLVYGHPFGTVSLGLGQRHGPRQIVPEPGADPGIDILRSLPRLQRLLIRTGVREG